MLRALEDINFTQSSLKALFVYVYMESWEVDSGPHMH